MMEKYGVEQTTYEVVIEDEVGKFKKIASDLSLSEANDLQKLNPSSLIRPE